MIRLRLLLARWLLPRTHSVHRIGTRRRKPTVANGTPAIVTGITQGQLAEALKPLATPATP